LKLSWQCCWGFKCYRMWCCVGWHSIVQEGLNPPKIFLLFMRKGLVVGNYWVWLALCFVWSRSGVQIWQRRLAVLTWGFFVGFSRWMEYEQDGISSTIIVLHVLLNKDGNTESCVMAVAVLWNVPLTHPWSGVGWTTWVQLELTTVWMSVTQQSN
jgi:hypothetical protein